METHPRAFAVACTSGYLPGLKALLSSIYVYHADTIPVFVFYELDAHEVEEIREHPTRPHLMKFEELSPRPAGSWEAKQCVPARLLPHVRVLYLLDADIVLTSELSDVFELAETGKIVSSQDGDGGVRYTATYRRYSPKIVGKSYPYVNSGALCFDVRRHWELAATWAFASQFAEYGPGGGTPLRLPGHGDQGLFNAIVAMLGKEGDIHVLPEATWCDSTKGTHVVISEMRPDGRLVVTNLTTGSLQRLVHSSGPKWWTPEGEEHLGKFGDKLRCFQHFAGERPGQADEGHP